MKKPKVNIKDALKLAGLSKEKTLTTLFLLPLVNLPKELRDKYHFVNSYLMDTSNSSEFSEMFTANPKIKIYSLFKPDSIKDFTSELDKENIEYYDVGYNLIMIISYLPDVFRSDYEHFINGYYSKFSEKAKKMFPDIKDAYRDGVKVGKEYTIHYHIFNRTDWMKELWMKRLNVVELDDDLEYWSRPIIESETFDINKIINKNEYNS